MAAAADSRQAVPQPAQGVADDDKARAQRSQRQIERALASIDFDSARWLAQFPGATVTDRGRRAERLLLAIAPLETLDATADSRMFVHAIVLDPAFELK